MLKISQIIDRVNTAIGKLAAWCILISVIISAINATTRFLFDIASNAALESQWMLFSVTFLFCAPWTLMLNEHIRIDIVNQRFRPSARYWIDILGHALVLIPFCVMMIITSVPSALRSYALNEQSFNAGGLPQWPAKMLIPLAFAFLLAQAISELIKRIAVLRGRLEEPYQNLGHHPAETEMEV